MVFDGGEKVVRDGKGQVQWSAYPNRFMNSLIVAITSTVLAVGMGTFTAYGFSRFKVKGEADLLFFILSTRMLPPVVVAIPMFLMYRAVGLNDTHWGLIILYTAFNLSFSVWLMKGFIDEIPKEYEEAALVDGYTRMEAFFKIVLPGGRDRHRRHRRVLLHHGVERICLRADHDQPPRADRAALHPEPGRLRPAGLDGDRRRNLPVPAAGRDLHLPAAQPSPARHDLRSDPQMSFRASTRNIWSPARRSLMVLGIIALCQPWNLFLHATGVTIILIGLVAFIHHQQDSRPRTEAETRADGPASGAQH